MIVNAASLSVSEQTTWNWDQEQPQQLTLPCTKNFSTSMAPPFVKIYIRHYQQGRKRLGMRKSALRRKRLCTSSPLQDSQQKKIVYIFPLTRAKINSCAQNQLVCGS